jgi:iron complex outermembrane recepter protein
MANRRIAHAVRTALMTAGAVGAASAGLYAPALLAQEALDEIVVTGSRIARRDAVAESPIFTVDQDAMRVSGFVTVEQYLNTLPQVVPTVSSQSNNPSSNGRAFIDLRGLGENRNLVLIDGRRGMGSTSGGVVDVNTIPASLIERVEVISGGAASTYGPDAIAGVVNFIMKKSFDGVAIDGQYRITEEGDGEEIGTDITFGSDFADGRGSAVFNAGYFKRQAIYKGARTFSAQATSPSGTSPGGNWATGGAATQPSQAAVDALFGPGACTTTGGSTSFQFNPDGSPFCSGVSGNPAFNMVGYTGPEGWLATNFTPDFFSYNFEPENILVLPLERWNMYSRFELDVNENFRPYAQFQFTNYNATQELAATPTAGATGFSVPITNPFIPASIQTLAASRANPTAPLSIAKRFTDLGGRTGDNTHDVWQTTIGATGDIVSSWKYDAYASWGRSVQLEAQGGNVNRDNAIRLLEAADGGASICEGGLNLFGTPGISQECNDYITFEAKNLTTVEQGIAEAVVTGDLFELPAGTVQSAFGASYRNLDFDFRPDGGLVPGRVAGFNAQLPVSGRLDFTDLFTEVVVPVVSDVPFIQALSLTGGLRWTDNNIFGSEETWKLTTDWTINDQVRFRGGLQHAVRAPNIAELFAPQVNNFPTFTNGDPCNTTGPNASNPEYGRNGPNGAAVQALCASQSSLAGGPTFVQPFGQANSTVGGNPNLEPETADSYTFGFVIAPQFDAPLFERMSFSIDYFNIELTDAIGGLGIFTIVQRCFNRDGSNPTYDPANLWCSLYERNEANGGVEMADQTQRNLSELNIDGVDFTADWAFGAGPGDLAFQLVGTWLGTNESRTLITPNDPTYDFAGTIGSVTGSSAPEWKVNLTTSYTMAAWQFQLTNRYISSMVHAETVTGGAGDPVDSTWYTDLTARYDLTDNFQIRAGINNLSNQQPRLYNPNVQAATDPSLYDVLGRRFFVGFNWRL